MADEATVRRDPRVPFQEIQGQAVIVVPARRQMHDLNEVATFVWRALEERRTLSELVGAVCEEFDVEQGRAEEDLRALLEELDGKGLLVRG